MAWLSHWIRPRRLLRAPDSRVTSLSDSEATLAIAGLFCGICANRVSASLNGLDAVESASCDLDGGTAVVRLRDQVDEDALHEAVLRAAIAMPLRRATERVARAIGL